MALHNSLTSCMQCVSLLLTLIRAAASTTAGGVSSFASRSSCSRCSTCSYCCPRHLLRTAGEALRIHLLQAFQHRRGHLVDGLVPEETALAVQRGQQAVDQGGRVRSQVGQEGVVSEVANTGRGRGKGMCKGVCESEGEWSET